MNIEWSGAEEAENFTSTLVRSDALDTPSGVPPVTRQLSQPIDFRCPQCDSIIYSRRNRLCGVCSQPLPEEFLFTPHETRRVERMIEAEKLRHKLWMNRIFKEAVSVR